jgi:acyl carrier protein
MSELRSNVTHIVASILQVDPGALDARKNLVELGLTSLGMVELLGELEVRHGVVIPPGEVTPENFATVDSVSGLLARLGAA